MKIQILRLPLQESGEYTREPYALIVSEVEREENVRDWAEKLETLTDKDCPAGPEYIITTEERVEVVQ